MSNKITPVSKFFKDYSCNPKRLFIVVAVIFAFIFMVFKVHPVVVLDSETEKPISGAIVNYRYVSRYIGSGCMSKSDVIASSNGIALFLYPVMPCEITARKDGYHISKERRPNYGINFVYLTKIEDPKYLINFKAPFIANNCVDLLSLLSNEQSDLISTNKDNCDLSIIGLDNQYTEEIINEEKTLVEKGGPLYRIEASGEGGIQELNKGQKGDYYNDGDELKKLSLIPDSGYSKTMDVYGGKAYVVRLRDGKHYAAFYFRPYKPGVIEITGSMHLDGSREFFSNKVLTK